MSYDLEANENIQGSYISFLREIGVAQSYSNLVNPIWSDFYELKDRIKLLQEICYKASVKGGWHNNIKTGEVNSKERTEELFPVRLMLIVSEISEAMEGHRKNLNDDKLPYRKMAEVELADAVIRIFDLAGAMEFDLAGAIIEKLLYNSKREDHKIENRKSEGGKAY